MGDPPHPLVRLVGRTWTGVKSPLYRNAFFIMLTGVITTGFGFLFWVVVTNLYAKEDVGVAVLLFQSLFFLGTLGNLGLGVGLIRYMPESENKPSMVNLALTLTGIVSLGLGLAFLVILQVVLPDLAFVLTNPYYMLAIVVTTIVLGLAPILDHAAIAVRRAEIGTWRDTIYSTLKIPLAALLFLVLPGRAGIFLSLAIAFLVAIVIQGFFLLPRAIAGFVPRPDVRMNRIRPLIRFSFGNFAAASIAGAGYLLPSPLIYAVLGPNSGPANVAYFYVALIVANLLYIIPFATSTSLLAEASQRDTDRRRGERQTVLLTIGLLIPAIAAMWFFSPLLLRLFGNPAFEQEAVTPLRILAFASIPFFLNGFLGTRIRFRKRTLPLVISAAITTGITLGLGWVLLQRPDLGIVGLAYAYVVGHMAATPYLLYAARGAYEATREEPVLAQLLESAGPPRP